MVLKLYAFLSNISFVSLETATYIRKCNNSIVE